MPIRLEIVTAERVLFDGEVDAVIAPGAEGELGVLPHHAAVMTTLQPGELRYRVGAEDGLRTYDVINGHCECSDYVRHGPGHPCKHRLAIELYEEVGAALSPSVPGQNEASGQGSPDDQTDDYI